MQKSLRARGLRYFFAPVVAIMVAITGCSFDPAQVSLPGAGPSGPTYTVHLELANALNLPARARVEANGARVGWLERVTVTDPSPGAPGSVRADIVVEESVKLPRDTRVQLRQDTILGDIYIALDITGGSDSRVIAPGGTVPIDQTEPALQVEDVLAGMATFVSGGAINSAQNVVNRVNAVLPTDPAETARIFTVLKNDLVDVAAHQDGISDFLDSIDTNAQMILSNKEALDEILTPQGVVDITQIGQSLIHVIGVIGALGGIAHALAWIAPLASGANAAARAFVPMLLNPGRPLNLSAPSNLNRLTTFLRDQLIPWASRPKVDVLGVRTETTRHGATMSTDNQVDQIVAALRMIGMVR